MVCACSIQHKASRISQRYKIGAGDERHRTFKHLTILVSMIYGGRIYPMPPATLKLWEQAKTGGHGFFFLKFLHAGVDFHAAEVVHGQALDNF